jgi:membrane-bound ClpP family serine protease
MENNITLPVILQLIGVIVIIAEIIIPSGGILSIIAAATFVYSLYIVFTGFSVGTGIVFIAADAILIPILVIVGLKLIAKSPVTLTTSLDRKNGVSSQSEELEDYIHKKGRAITDLRPAGVAEINGTRVDVVSRGEYIEKGSEIIVMEVTGNRVVVRENNIT